MAVRMKLVPENWIQVNAKEATKEVSNVEGLDEKFKENAEKLLKRLSTKGVKITEDNRILYPSGVVGSDLTDMLKYVLYPTSRYVPRPPDSELLLEILGDSPILSAMQPKLQLSLNKMTEDEKPWKSFT